MLDITKIETPEGLQYEIILCVIRFSSLKINVHLFRLIKSS